MATAAVAMTTKAKVKTIENKKPKINQATSIESVIKQIRDAGVDFVLAPNNTKFHVVGLSTIPEHEAFQVSKAIMSSRPNILRALVKEKQESEIKPGIIINEGRMRVTPPMARAIIDDCGWEKQRPIDNGHVRFLASEMQRGVFGPGSQLAFCKFKGSLYLVNGYHRSLAIIESNTAQDFQVFIHTVNSMEEIGDIYHQYDIGVRKRSSSVVLEAGEFSKTHGMSKTSASKLYNAAVLIENGFKRLTVAQDSRMRSPTYRIDVMKKYVQHMLQYEAAIKPADKATRARLYNLGPLAVGIATFKYQPQKALEFWSELANNDGLSRNDPRTVLRTDLLTRLFNTKSQSQGEMACAIAWNHFFNGRPLNKIQIVSDMKFRLAGTIWTA